jgi:zinc transport system permease protein
MSFLALPFMRIALSAAVLAGTALALLGVFMTARRIAFSGLAASQAAALGTVIGASLGWHWGAEAMAWMFAVLGMVWVAWLSRSRRTPADSWVACLYVVGAAAAVLVLAKSPRGESETLGIFFGNILTLTGMEVIEASVLFVGVAVLVALFQYRWRWLSVDPGAAEVAGLRVGRWNFFFQVLFAAAMTLTIHIAGVLLAFAFLILPAAAAFLLARRVRGLWLWVLAATPVLTTLGFALSYRWDFPTGPFVAGLLAVWALAARVYVGLRGEV